MYFQNPLDFFIKSFILPGKMPAPAALHKGGHLQFFISIFTKTMGPPIQCRKTSCAGADGLRTGAGQHNNLLHRRIPSYSHFKNNISLKIHLFLSSVNSIIFKIISHIIHHMNI